MIYRRSVNRTFGSARTRGQPHHLLVRSRGPARVRPPPNPPTTLSMTQKGTTPMSTNADTPARIRRPLTFCYIGRPVSLYIDALDRSRRTRSNP